MIRFALAFILALSVSIPIHAATSARSGYIPTPLLEIAIRHVADAALGPVAQDWDGARVSRKAVPLYRADLRGVAYWELKVTRGHRDAGFVIVSTGAHDFPIPHWRTTGPTPSEELAARRGKKLSQGDRVLRVDSLDYAIETAADRANPKADATDALARARWFSSLRAEAAAAWREMAATQQEPGKDDPAWATFHTPEPSPTYGQIEAGQRPNTSACLSGCGATAWAILFGWADIQAATNPAWANAWGIYRKDGGRGEDEVAPEAMDAGAANMTWEIRSHLGTWCSSGQGATGPWNMGGAAQYLAGRTSARIEYFYNSLGAGERRLTNRAIEAITRRNTPAIIGTGWLKHYPVAIAYTYKLDQPSAEWFYVNQGWSGSGNDWVAPSTWFAGSILP